MMLRRLDLRAFLLYIRSLATEVYSTVLPLRLRLRLLRGWCRQRLAALDHSPWGGARTPEAAAALVTCRREALTEASKLIERARAHERTPGASKQAAVETLKVSISLADEYPLGARWRLVGSQQRLAFAKSQHERLGEQSRSGAQALSLDICELMLVEALGSAPPAVAVAVTAEQGGGLLQHPGEVEVHAAACDPKEAEDDSGGETKHRAAERLKARKREQKRRARERKRSTTSSSSLPGTNTEGAELVAGAVSPRAMEKD